MVKENYKIIPLPKAQWEGTIIPIGYTTYTYYDVTVEKNADGYGIKIEKKTLDERITHTPEEYDFPDKLYAPHWEKAFAWGIVAEGKETPELMACI